jgi:hypothetical protein
MNRCLHVILAGGEKSQSLNRALPTESALTPDLRMQMQLRRGTHY